MQKSMPSILLDNLHFTDLCLNHKIGYNSSRLSILECNMEKGKRSFLWKFRRCLINLVHGVCVMKRKIHLTLTPLKIWAQERSNFLTRGLILVLFIWTLLEMDSMNTNTRRLHKMVVWLEMKEFSYTLPDYRIQYNEFLNNSRISMADPLLVNIIRKHYIIPPTTLPYNFTNSELNEPEKNSNPSKGAVQAVSDILETFITDPFYVECGASDGEWGSNSIWLEKLEWQGLLIEADPSNFQKLEKKHRKAYLGRFCLSNTVYPQIVDFYQDKRGRGLGSSLIKNNKTTAQNPIQVQCFPLLSVLLAMDRVVVDFLSLDVEGSELDILKTMDFNTITFKVIAVENLLVSEGYEDLKNFLEYHGYVHYEDVNQDSIFLHQSVSM